MKCPMLGSMCAEHQTTYYQIENRMRKEECAWWDTDQIGAL